MNKKLLQAIKNGNTHYFYTSWTWRKKRKQILIRDNNECQMCKKEGKVTVGTKDDPLVVHHMKELRQYPELALTDENLLSVCNNCHENVCHPDKLGEYKKTKTVIDIPERW